MGRELRVIATEIENIYVGKESKLQDLYDDFFAIMRSHGIRKTEKVGNGIIDTPEWLICYNYFMYRVNNHLAMQEYVTHIPNDLLKY